MAGTQAQLTYDLVVASGLATGLSLDAFIEEMTGRCYTHPGYSPPYQCTDLVAAWCDNLGLPRFSGDAVDYAGQHLPPWTWIANVGSLVPLPGDVVCFRACGGTEGIGVDGHTDICVEASAASARWTGFDQNWAYPSSDWNGTCWAPQQVTHDYTCVAGWQRPPSVPPPTPVPTPTPTPTPTPSPEPPGPGGVDWSRLIGYLAVLGGGAAVGVYFLHREGGSVREVRDKYLARLAPPGSGFSRRRGRWRTADEEAALFGRRVAEAQGFDPGTPGVDWQAYGEEARYRMGKRQKVPSPAEFGARQGAPAPPPVAETGMTGPPRWSFEVPPRSRREQPMVRIGDIEMRFSRAPEAAHRPRRQGHHGERTTGYYRLDQSTFPPVVEPTIRGWRAQARDARGQVVATAQARDRDAAIAQALEMAGQSRADFGYERQR